MADNTFRIPGFLLDTRPPGMIPRDRGTVRFLFIEKGLRRLAVMVKQAYSHSGRPSQHSFFHKLDARIKILFLLFFMLIVSLKTSILSEVYLFCFISALALFSKVNLLAVYKRVLFLGFFFGFLIALPSACNLISKGEILFPLLKFPKAYSFWTYSIPQEIGMTKEGMAGVLLLTMRVINSLSLTFWVLTTTPFADLIRALKVLKIPDGFLLVITLCHQYLFLFARVVANMYLAKKSRRIREGGPAEVRSWITDRMAFLFRKTRLRCEEVYQAMIGRGFSDTIKIHGFRKLARSDWGGAIFLFAAGLLFLLG